MLNLSISRFTIEVSLSSFYVALPGIGEAFYSRDMGFVYNRWGENAIA